MYMFRVGSDEYDEIVFAFAETMHALRERFGVYDDVEHAFNYSPYRDVVTGVYEAIAKFAWCVDDEDRFRRDISEAAADLERLHQS